MAQRKKKRKPFVHYSTIWNNVGGGLNYPNESKVCKVGKHKILLTRASKLDRYGNPVHTATLINKDGTTGLSARTNGTATLCVSNLLKKMGIDTKHKAYKVSAKKKKANEYVKRIAREDSGW